MASGAVVELQRNSTNWGKVVGEIVKIEKKIFPKHESLAKSFDEEIKKKNSGLLYLELINGEVGGYVMYSWPSSLCASITKLAVKENYWRHGHGEALLRAAIEKCKTRKVHRISLHVDPLRTPAVSLYKKLGFQVDDLVNEDVHEKFQMWKAWKFPALISSDDDRVTAQKGTMDKELYLWAVKDNFDELFQLISSANCEAQVMSIIGKHFGPSGNSLLHGAAGSGRRHTTELLVHHFPLLITRKNFHGDTALHAAAAGDGGVDTTRTLLNYFTGRKKAELLRMRNDSGNTGLHEAIMNGNYNVAEFLASEDPEILYCKNSEDKCPLYLAVEAKNKELLCYLLDALNFMPKGSSGEINKFPEGKSVAHAAVEVKNSEMLNEIVKRKPELLRVKDENGDNLLHFVSSKDNSYDIHCLLIKLGLGDCALETNSEGQLPIHVACQSGNLEVVKSFLGLWPNPTEFLNEKGQNVLHVAAENGRGEVVKHILDAPWSDKIVNKKDREGNAPLHLATKNGSSMAVYALVKHEKVNIDIKNSENLTPYSIALHQVKIEEDGLSEKPSSEEDKKLEAIRKSNDGSIQKNGNEQARSMADVHEMGKQSQLQPGHATDGKKQYPLFYYGMGMTLSILYFCANDRKQALSEYMRVQSQSDPPRRKELKNRINSLLVVSVLVAGVTFAGAIQLPGGGNFDPTENSTLANSKATSFPFDQQHSTSTTHSGWYHIFRHISDNNPEILKKKSKLFRGYVFFSTSAFNAALMSSTILCWAQLYDTKVAAWALWVASILIGLSIYMMWLAFAFAMGIAVGKFIWTFMSIMVLEGFLFFAQTLFYIPLLRPPRDCIGGFSLSPRVYYIAFKIYYSSVRCLSAVLAAKDKRRRL